METIRSIQELINSIKEDCVFTTKCFAKLVKAENLNPPEQAIFLKLRYINESWKPGLDRKWSYWDNFYTMLDDMVRHIQVTQGKDLITTVNVMTPEDSSVKIEFISKSNQIWMCPIDLLHQKNNHPEKWKTVFLNMHKSSDPTIVLLEYINNIWKSSSNRDVSCDK